MAHDDHFHCFDHGGPGALATRTDTYKRTDPAVPDEIEFFSLTKDLNDLAARSGGLATVSSLGRTPGRFGGRDIRMIRLGKDFGVAKPKALITAGLHAREWITPTFAYLIAEFLIDNQFLRVASDILEEHHLFIVPMANPDGHEYTVTTDRFFRGNSPAGNPRFVEAVTMRRLGRRRGAAESVDLNRNFLTRNRDAILASGRGSFSSNPTSELFAGRRRAFETGVLQNLIRAQNFDTVIDIHSYGCFCMHSPADDVRALSLIDPVAAPRYQVFLDEIGALLRRKAPVNITVGPGPDVWRTGQASAYYGVKAGVLGLPALAPEDVVLPGSLMDFAFYHPRPAAPLRTLAFAYELPPAMGTDHTIGFDPPESVIRPTFSMCAGSVLSLVRLSNNPTPVAADFAPFGAI